MPGIQDSSTVGDLALEDLSQQLAATACQLAVTRAHFAKLSDFVRANASALGLQTDGGADISASVDENISDSSEVDSQTQSSPSEKPLTTPLTTNGKVPTNTAA